MAQLVFQLQYDMIVARNYQGKVAWRRSLRTYCWEEDTLPNIQMQVNEQVIVVNWSRNQVALHPDTGEILWHTRALAQRSQPFRWNPVAI